MAHNRVLPFLDFGGSGQVLHFAHANAYPPAAYKDLIQPLLHKHRVIAYEQRPLWPDAPEPQSLTSWQVLVDDLIRFLDQQQLQNIIGIGHSMGSVVSFMAACKRPDLFRALVMIEPVAFSRTVCWFNRSLPWFFKQRIALIQKTLNRPDCWESQQAAFDFHRKARAFARVSDAALWSYIQAGVVNHEGSWKLRFPKAWEARCYGAISFFRSSLLNSQLPVLAFRGVHQSTIPDVFWQHWQQNTHHRLIEMPDHGHLLPLEAPTLVSEHILEFLTHHA
ncbi:alpha/beta fold hydrolase [Marinicella sp. W31]|uniref:alpha/beta fold hydrolase n=1 Tax=Marinicella sp. W31 TaxID=3023713 RepID=UPI0037579086